MRHMEDKFSQIKVRTRKNDNETIYAKITLFNDLQVQETVDEFNFRPKRTAASGTRGYRREQNLVIVPENAEYQYGKKAQRN